MPQIHNQNLLVVFSAGNQARDITVNIPFRVGKIVFHPPKVNKDAAATLDVNDKFLVRSSLNKGGGIVGFFDGTEGRDSSCGDITVSVEDPLFINGSHRISIHSIRSLSGGANAEYVGSYWQLVEFHEATTIPTAFLNK